jgi:hypothetical protein
MPRCKTIRTPRVGERVVNTAMWGLGRKGRREEGYSDPAKKMAWVRWDDGKTEGEFLKDLIPETEYANTTLYCLLEGKK